MSNLRTERVPVVGCKLPGRLLPSAYKCTASAGEAVRVFKNGIAEALLKEFPAFERTQNLWTRDFYATTSPRPNKAEIERFLNLQKTQS